MDEARARVVNLDLNDVLPNRFQPRIKFNEDSIIELSESIKEHGVIQPIVVRPIGDKYEIIAGERRYKASVLAGKETIPAIITDLNDKDSAEVALIENVQRKDLTAIEEAISYKKILDMGYLTQEQLAIKLGRSQSTIANKIRLLNLCDEVQEALMEDKISERHARSMLKLQTAEQQRILLEKIIKERLTVRKTDEEIDKMNTYITEPIDNQEQTLTNPGFVDVDKIANNAQDLQFEDSAGKVDINALLQGNSSTAVNPVDSTIPVMPAIETIPNNNIFNAAPVDLMAPEPVAPFAPTIPIEPIAPVTNVTSEPAVDLQKAYDLPPVPLVDPFNPNATPIMPTQQTVVSAPDISVSPVASVMPNEQLFQTVPAVAPGVPSVPQVTPEITNVPETPIVPVVPVVPEVQPAISSSAVEPVVPVGPSVTPAMTNVPEIPVVSSSSAVTAPIPSIFAGVPTIEPVVETNSSIFMGVPTITPIMEQSVPANNIAPSPTTPIVEGSLPSNFLDNDTKEEPPAAPVSTVMPISNELLEAEPKLEDNTAEIKPIIITDYSKQYDPILPQSTAPVIEKVDFKQVINLIRDVNNSIEKYGYTVETEEYDLEGIYQVIFKINKD